MKEFYQSPEFMNAVAACTVALIGILFIVGLHPFKKERKHVPTAEWTGSSYYIFLMAAIKTCTTYEQLERVKRLVERFFNTRFSDKVSGKERMDYYTRLHKALTEKENFLEENTLTATVQAN